MTTSAIVIDAPRFVTIYASAHAYGNNWLGKRLGHFPGVAVTDIAPNLPQRCVPAV
jgi:hypothetical protein